MGVAQFFNVIRQHFYLKTGIQIIANPIEVDYLLLDFNSLIYPAKERVISNLNNSLELYLIQNDINNEQEIQTKVNELISTIDNKIQDLTMEYVSKLVTKCTSNLDTLYISIDGTPSVAKMVEQRKRRFMGKLLEHIELELIEKYKSELSNQKTKKNYKNRYLFEKYKIRWSSSNISPGTKFLKSFGEKLNDSAYISKYVTVKNYIFSSFTSPGEGEKKIMNLISNKLQSKKIMIFSPDADVILLPMLMPSHDITIIRQDDRSDNILNIHIPTLNKRFYDYLQTFPNAPTKNFKQENFIRDLIFIFTFFGDDFVPKLESYGIKFHLPDLFQAYIVGYKKEGYLTKYQYVNQKCLIVIIEELAKKEKIILIDKYLFSYYKSYGFLRTKFNEWCFINKINTEKLLFPAIFRKCIYLYFYITSNYTKHGSKFISQIDKFDNDYKFIMNVLYNIFLSDDFGDGVKEIKNLLIKNKGLPYLNLPLHKRNLQTQVRMEMRGKSFDLLPYNLTQIQKKSEFDIMLFGIEKMIDIRTEIAGIDWGDYFDKNMSTFYDLGKVDIPSSGNKYKFNYEYYSDSMISKFNSYQFGKSNPTIEYLNGIMWTFYYYNSNTDLSLNTWFYPFRKAPLLIDTLKQLKKDGYDINKFGMANYNKTTVSEKYYTIYQQIAMITPLEDITVLPDDIIKKYKQSSEYMKFIKSYNPDLKQMAQHIINYKKPSPLNCKDHMFFNSCTIKGSEDIPEKLQQIVKKMNV